MKDMIRVSKISRHYNVGKQIVKALDSITVNVKRNEYISFMGPSGSGKSTLMNIIGCLDSPTGGNYVLNNKGTLNIIEIIKPYNNIKSFIFNLGFFILAPFFGMIFSNNFSAYLYLPKSSNTFLTEKGINSLLQKHGFKKIIIKKKAFGSVILLNALKSN